MTKRKVRVMNRTTLLIMGEGEHDKAFLNHMNRPGIVGDLIF